MKTNYSYFKGVDAYIETFQEDVQILLQEIRETIINAAPEAEECINYKIPTYKVNGNLVHFSGYKKHIGFYPGPSGITAFKNEISIFKSAKGSVQFPIDVALPIDLISKIVKYRVAENLSK